MNSLLSEMDSAPVSVRNMKRKSAMQYESASPSSPLSSGSGLTNFRSSHVSSGITSSDPPETDHFTTSDDLPFSPSKKAKFKDDRASVVTPAAGRLSKMALDSSTAAETISDSLGDIAFDTDDMFMDVDAEHLSLGNVTIKQEEDLVAPPPVAENKSNNIMKEEKDHKESELPSWLGVHTALTVIDDVIGTSGSKTSKSVNTQVLEEDGSLHFYWLDYLENDGKVYFIGKVIDKETNGYVSCCVTVEGIERNLFVLPRQQHLGKPRTSILNEAFVDITRRRKCCSVRGRCRRRLQSSAP